MHHPLHYQLQSQSDSNVPAWAQEADDGLEHRVEAVSQYAGVCTFIAGFALADLGGLEYDFEFPVGEIYMVLMSFAAGCTACNAVLGILLVVVYRRLLSWDMGRSKRFADDPSFVRGTNEYEKDHHLFLEIFGDPGEKRYSKHVFDYIYNGSWAPLRIVMVLFPWAIAAYLSAVAVKVVAASEKQTLVVKSICPVMLALFLFPMLKYARQMVQLVIR